MTTRIEVADAQFVGPKYRLDRRHGDGTLLHLNPRHPAGKWADGVPADGALLPNIARLEAADLIGPTTPPAALAATFRNTGFVGSDGLAERTTKGGLHVITSRTAAAEHYFHIDWPTLVASFITGAASSLYICLIGRTTRRGAASALVRASSATGGIVRQSITEVNAGGTPGSAISGSPTSGANYLGRNFADSPGLFMVDTATSGPPSTWPAGAGMNPILGIFGNLSASTVGNTPAWIFYDLIVEDLTRSKRTYTEAHALSQEYYTREFLTPGGLYYGDTYTAPAA